ncbi:hypothetical protein ElyMa_005695200 [Elysia marginata]|uniref:Uncharacterized protein n=1 Tax=Elysia marginata TaxID=1093978 RepID=A0AAV4FG63_9GAST|nr:hypothetical protein ElyMa_005695200 [Elysia marginata]
MSFFISYSSLYNAAPHSVNHQGMSVCEFPTSRFPGAPESTHPPGSYRVSPCALRPASPHVVSGFTSCDLYGPLIPPDAPGGPTVTSVRVLGGNSSALPDEWTHDWQVL